jgi:putative endonuclease
MRSYFVYIAANRFRTVFYTGMTNDLHRRIVEHKGGTGSRFTTRYRVRDLLYFEEHRQVRDAIAREKEIKRWRREKKLALVRSQNPELKDLAADLDR